MPRTAWASHARPDQRTSERQVCAEGGLHEDMRGFPYQSQAAQVQIDGHPACVQQFQTQGCAERELAMPQAARVADAAPKIGIEEGLKAPSSR